MISKKRDINRTGLSAKTWQEQQQDGCEKQIETLGFLDMANMMHSFFKPDIFIYMYGISPSKLFVITPMTEEGCWCDGEFDQSLQWPVGQLVAC